MILSTRSAMVKFGGPTRDQRLRKPLVTRIGTLPRIINQVMIVFKWEKMQFSGCILHCTKSIFVNSNFRNQIQKTNFVSRFRIFWLFLWSFSRLLFFNEHFIKFFILDFYWEETVNSSSILITKFHTLRKKGNVYLTQKSFFSLITYIVCWSILLSVTEHK